MKMSIKEIRQEKGLTQKECAAYLRIPLRTYKRYESDEANQPDEISIYPESAEWVPKNRWRTRNSDNRTNTENMQWHIPGIWCKLLLSVRLLREREGTRGQRCGKTHQEIPWLAIKGMRNKIVHDDGYVDLTVVYDTVMHGIPEMYEKLKEIS